jgi:hypothetical protein
MRPSGPRHRILAKRFGTTKIAGLVPNRLSAAQGEDCSRSFLNSVTRWPWLPQAAPVKHKPSFRLRTERGLGKCAFGDFG